jgi:hypothetical protein
MLRTASGGLNLVPVGTTIRRIYALYQCEPNMAKLEVVPVKISPISMANSLARLVR